MLMNAHRATRAVCYCVTDACITDTHKNSWIHQSTTNHSQNSLPSPCFLCGTALARLLPHSCFCYLFLLQLSRLSSFLCLAAQIQVSFFCCCFFKGHHLMSVCDIRAIWSNLTMLLFLVDISVTSQLSKLPVGTLSLWKAMLISYQWVSYHKHTPPPFDYFCNNEGWREVPQADMRTKRIEIKMSLLWLWETSRSNKV